MSEKRYVKEQNISLIELAEKVEADINLGSTSQIVTMFMENKKEELLREMIPLFKVSGNRDGVLAILDQTIPIAIYY